MNYGQQHVFDVLYYSHLVSCLSKQRIMGKTDITCGLNHQPYRKDAMFGTFVVQCGVTNQNKLVPCQLVVLKQGNVGRSVT